MSLSNSLMYEGQLECGSERTATALLALPLLPSVQSELGSNSASDPRPDLAWVQSTLLPSNPVCFLDCSKVGPTGWILLGQDKGSHSGFPPVGSCSGVSGAGRSQ